MAEGIQGMSELIAEAGRRISRACELELEKHGDNFRGAGYTRSEKEAEDQYTFMLNVCREPASTPASVLDIGCGLAHMLDHINNHDRYRNISYTGLDISEKYIEAARKRHPDANLFVANVFDSDEDLGIFDYVIMNGIFNYRGDISFADMMAYWERMTSIAFRHCSRGIAFNVMSKIVDWERDDLFHLPFDDMAQFVSKHLSRYFVINHDYPRFEYTTYVYKEPISFP